MDLNLALGRMCSPILEQIKDEGLKCDIKTVKLYQKEVNAILMLWENNIITEKERIRFFKKVCKKIFVHVQIINKNIAKDPTFNHNTIHF